MFSHDDIKSGLFVTYYDYDRPLLFRHQILITISGAGHVTNFIAILITLTLPCFFVLIRRATIAVLLSLRKFFSWAYCKVKESGSHDHTVLSLSQVPEDEDHTVLGKLIDQLEAPADEDNPFKAARKVLAGIHDHVRLEDNEDQPVGIWVEFVTYLKNTWDTLVHLRNDLALAFAVILAIIFFLALLALGLYLSIISSDVFDGSIVCSASHLAGNWESDPSSASFLLGEGAIISENRQSRIWLYKQSCYGSNNTNSACNTYYRRQLPIYPALDTSCPFDGDACLFKNQSAYKLTTGLLDSNLLGVNAPASKRFHFSRTISCAPLRTDDKYVYATGNISYPNQWAYDYGPSLFDAFWEYTYVTPREWRLRTVDIDDISPYRMGLSLYNPFDEEDVTFIPHPEFRAGNKTVTILFVSTGGLHLHLFERDDPIFPAHTGVQLRINPNTYSTFWYNNSTRAGVLGCVDSYEICTDASGMLCWDQSNSSLARQYFTNDLARQRALYLVQVGLQHFDTWNVVNYKQADALNATSEIKRIIGINLAREQWKVEVENFFAASLAAVQTRVYDFARGTYAHHPSMIDRTPMELQGSDSDIRAAVLVARMFKFRDMSYTNISAFAFWGIIGLVIVVFLASRRFSNAQRRAEVEDKTGDGGYYNWLWVAIVWRSVFVAAGKAGGDLLYRQGKGIGGWAYKRAGAISAWVHNARSRVPSQEASEREDLPVDVATEENV